jgi:hypothetical protein
VELRHRRRHPQAEAEAPDEAEEDDHAESRASKG